MKRRLGIRDRVAWLIALVALAVVLYVVVPLWALVSTIAVIFGVLVLVRWDRHDRAHG